MPSRKKPYVFFAVLACIGLLSFALSVYKIAMANAYRTFADLPALAPLPVPPQSAEAAQASHARGERLLAIVGCRDCHGADLSGRVLADGSDGLQLSAANLPGAPGSVTEHWQPSSWQRVLRLGIDAERRALWGMPRDALLALKDADVAALCARLQAPQPVLHALSQSRLTAWGYWRVATRKLKLFERTAPRVAAASASWVEPVPQAPSPELGDYLLRVGRCQNCHDQSAPGQTWLGAPRRPLLARGSMAPGTSVDAFAAAWRASACQTTAAPGAQTPQLPRADLFTAQEMASLLQALRDNPMQAGR